MRPSWRGFPGNWRPISPRSPRRKAKRLRTRRRHTWRRFPPLYLMDTTGLAYRSKDRLLRFRRGKEVRRVRGHARLLALMRWDRERRLLWPWGGVVGEGYAPDPRLGGEVLRRFPPSRGWLLADAGFDGKEVWGVLGEAGGRPVIRLRGGG
ncbi:IS5-like element ISTth7 family transposase, partial [Thermus thermophilus]